MPRIIPVHWRRLERVFLAAGFHYDRSRGDHRMYLKDGVQRPVVIPTYGSVPVFIIEHNLKTAGLSRDEYFSLLEGA